jgi:hypothetical protein
MQSVGNRLENENLRKLRFLYRKCNNWVKNLFVVNFSCFFSRKFSYVGCIKMVRCMLITWDNFGALVLFFIMMFLAGKLLTKAS